MISVFFYAERMNGRGRKAEMPGELRLRPNGDGAAKFAKNETSTVKGEIHKLTRSEVQAISRQEKGGPGDDYEMEDVETTDGTQCIAFTLQGSDEKWKAFRRVPSGRWDRSMER